MTGTNLIRRAWLRLYLAKVDDADFQRAAAENETELQEAIQNLVQLLSVAEDVQHAAEIPAVQIPEPSSKPRASQVVNRREMYAWRQQREQAASEDATIQGEQLLRNRKRKADSEGVPRQVGDPSNTRQRRCSNCNEPGHTKKTCRNPRPSNWGIDSDEDNVEALSGATNVEDQDWLQLLAEAASSTF